MEAKLQNRVYTINLHSREKSYRCNGKTRIYRNGIFLTAAISASWRIGGKMGAFSSKRSSQWLLSGAFSRASIWEAHPKCKCILWRNPNDVRGKSNTMPGVSKFQLLALRASHKYLASRGRLKTWQACVGLFFNREETVQGHALFFDSAGHQGASGCTADLGLARIPLVCPGFPGATPW